jgi:WD40 repeat protein
VRKPPARHFYTVLAASSPHTRRRALAAIAGVVLVVALAAGGAVIAVQPSPRGPVSTSSGHKPAAAVSGGRLIATLSGPGGQVESLAALSPDGKTLAVITGAADGGGPASVRLWDVGTRRWAATLTLSYGQCDGGVSSVAYSPDGKTLAMFSHIGHETCLWNQVTRKVTILTDPGPGIDGTAGGFSSGGTTLVVADTDGRIYLWDLATKHVTATLNVPDEPANPRAQVAYSAAAVSPDGLLAAVAPDGAGDGQVDVFDLATKRQTATLNDPGGGYVRRLSFSPDGMLAIGDGGGKGNVYLWNAATRKFMGTVVPPVNRAQAQAARRSADAAPPGASAVFSPDGMSLATTAAYGYGTYLYDVANRELLATLTDPGASTSMLPAVAFSPDGPMMAVVESNGRTYLWRLTSRRIGRSK